MSMPNERSLNPFVKESPEPGDISDPRLVRLLEHWRTLNAGLSADQLPLVARIDALQLGFILGWLMMMDPIDGGADFRYRLYGSSIAATSGPGSGEAGSSAGASGSSGGLESGSSLRHHLSRRF